MAIKCKCLKKRAKQLFNLVFIVRFSVDNFTADLVQIDIASVHKDVSTRRILPAFHLDVFGWNFHERIDLSQPATRRLAKQIDQIDFFKT